MYRYIWDKETGGYQITTESSNYVANEIRPVFADELLLAGFDKYYSFDHEESRPFMWAQKNVYYYKGERIAQLIGTQYGKQPELKVYSENVKTLTAIDIERMLQKNAEVMGIIIADAKRRIKELYDKDIHRCDAEYIAFSGGKDSVALLDLCDQVLPLSIPVIFSDTDMELPDTYSVWKTVKNRYSNREFLVARAEKKALENWELFGPPSRTIRWCCSVHKSTPALLILKKRINKPTIKVMAFTGVRGDESIGRSHYGDSSDGVKNASQLHRMPILDWGAHELWLYIFTRNLPINNAYKKGLPRVGCIMCPESSDKYEWFINEIYPGLIKPYADVIIKTSSKSFDSVEEQNDFIGSSNWQARKSGVVLKKNITNPVETVSDLSISFQSAEFKRDIFFEWIKTLGDVLADRETGRLHLKLPHTLDDGIPISYIENPSGDICRFDFRSQGEKESFVPWLRKFFKKAMCCVACRDCEAECPVGAITAVSGMIRIDGEKCIRCHQCYNIDNACWRFKSMYMATNDQKKMTGINRYNNFGLREKGRDLWISTAVEMKEDFFPWNESHPLGKKMVESASAWFQQSYLYEPKTRKPSVLLSLFEKFGGTYEIGWDLIWMALANNAVLVKWFVASTEIDHTYTIEELANMMSTKYASLGKSTINGGLAALKDMLTKSPLGGDFAVTNPEMKGRSVIKITRRSKNVDAIVILFGLYLNAILADRESFTVREMLVSNEDGEYISPVVAFGLSADTFKKQCEGLRTKYPDYIGTTFTHGNDEFQVYYKKHSLSDIISLALED